MIAAAGPSVDLLDVIIVVAVLIGIVGGFRLGLFARALSWVGLVAAVAVAVHYLPSILRTAHLASSGSRLLVAAVVLVGGAFVGQAVGMLIGSRLHAVLPLGGLRSLDKLLGGVAGGLGVLVALWFLLPSVSSVAGWPARATRGSAISRWVSNDLPTPPDALLSLRNLVGTGGFPAVFDSLAPGQSAGAPPGANPLSAAVTARIEASSVKVEGMACGRLVEGSGFAIRYGVVLTNAHVVAGEPPGSTDVVTPSGRTLAARVVAYDPDRDLALLRVVGLDEAPLRFAPTEVGQVGAAFGHPGGQAAIAVQPARVAQVITAVGSDLYSTHRTTRQVAVLAATLEPGDSGGPVVDRAGLVVGVSFAIALDRSDTAYALTTGEVAPFVAQRPQASVSTEGCVG